MKKLLSFLILGLVLLCSCDEPDGLWDPMKWKTNVPGMKKDHIIEVPSVGGTYVLKCKNYAGFWISSIDGMELGDDEDMHNVAREWYTVIIEGNVMTVTIASNECPDDRTLDIGIRCGNATDGFTFEQSKAEER